MVSKKKYSKKWHLKMIFALSPYLTPKRCIAGKWRRAIAIISQKFGRFLPIRHDLGSYPLSYSGYCIQQVTRLRAPASDCIGEYSKKSW